MSSAMKFTLVILGLLTAVLVLMQLTMGLLIASGRVNLVKAHQHSGYLTVAMAILYVGLSLSVIVSLPRRPNP